jgi:hypothetical protein
MADSALGFVQPTDYVGMIGEAHEVRGIVLAAAGRAGEATAALRDALASFERKGIVPQIARVREWIEALPD